MKRFPKNVAGWRPEQHTSRFLFAEVPVVKPLPVRASLKIFKKPSKERDYRQSRRHHSRLLRLLRKGPIVKIIPDNTFYTQVTPEDAEEIISEHIIGGRRIERLLYIDPKTEQTVSDSKHMDFYRKQLRIALRNCGFIDSENIEEYIAREGYFALADCLLNKQPADVIDIIKRSGLRGRGGGGFPTGLKWEFASKQVSNVKYVVCNADEGDPGAFMDRSIMEGDPHSIVEAMCICGYSIGSSKGLVYIRAEYPLAINRLKKRLSKPVNTDYWGTTSWGQISAST